MSASLSPITSDRVFASQASDVRDARLVRSRCSGVSPPPDERSYHAPRGERRQETRKVLDALCENRWDERHKLVGRSAGTSITRPSTHTAARPLILQMGQPSPIA